MAESDACGVRHKGSGARCRYLSEKIQDNKNREEELLCEYVVIGFIDTTLHCDANDMGKKMYTTAGFEYKE